MIRDTRVAILEVTYIPGMSIYYVPAEIRHANKWVFRPCRPRVFILINSNYAYIRTNPTCNL